ncbi:hypothetical protein WOLCODRAFT_109613 [Wolfiporia cocos MD-104 SS10]|uniref:Uncharacterized protein n=1 Tax=Wolfiporia cocos (strain MD-104) TaxID=742152 RepID=A0A2H3JHD1_WOLCO|nr:hypothetical protein WOLCODRAFT_109613 [Wolfiporia cocos MD-104 SS10]
MSTIDEITKPELVPLRWSNQRSQRSNAKPHEGEVIGGRCHVMERLYGLTDERGCMGSWSCGWCDELCIHEGS